jgi:xylulokinase
VNDDDLCLAVDLGTGGLKVGLVTMAGAVGAYEVHDIATHFGDDGSATQDAGEWWDLIVDAARRLLGSVAGARERVVAVAVTGQYASTVPVDAAGEPTAECVTWLDTRGVRHARRVLGGPIEGYRPGKLLHFVRTTGAVPSVGAGDPVGQILYLEAERAEVVARTRWYMEPVDYLTMRFTGVASATHASRVAMWMTDNRVLDSYRYDQRLLALVGLTDERLPPLAPIGSLVGSLAPSVATALGLSGGAVVVTGVPDVHAAALGAGATRPYEVHVALSTTSWVSCPVPAKKTDVFHQIAAGPGLTNDSYLLYDNQETGARALAWCRDVLAAAGGPPSFDELTALAATSPPGARGVLFTPWLAGERSPVADRHLRGGFTNLSVTTTGADVVRSVMEGVAANSRWLFGYVERFVGRELSPVRLLGGGAQSELWCQIYADTLDREVEQVPQPMVAQLRGAASLAAVALGRRSLEELSAHRSKGRVFTPDSAEVPGYRRRGEEFVSLYRRDRRWRRQRGRRSP